MEKTKSKLLTLITVISLVLVCACLPLYATFVIWPSYDQLVISTTEKGLQAVAVAIIKDQQLLTPLSNETTVPPLLINEVERMRRTLSLPKIKIFTPQGQIVYSSAPEDIGNFTSQEFFPQMLIDGRARSKLAQKRLRHDDGRELAVEVIETYVPILNGPQAIGAFEIYYDVTEITRSLYHLMRNHLQVLAPTALILLIIALASTYYAQKSIHDLAVAKNRFKELSMTDNLTGLLNHRGFKQSVDRQLKIIDRGDKYAFLIFIDLNDFKQINDNFGHEMGDKALEEAAGILKNTFRNSAISGGGGSDIIGRIGGDEFAILTTQNNVIDDAQVLGRRLDEHIRLWNASHNEGRYSLSMSYGIVTYSPHQPCSFDELIQKADALMYSNKQQHKKKTVQS